MSKPIYKIFIPAVCWKLIFEFNNTSTVRKEKKKVALLCADKINNSWLTSESPYMPPHTKEKARTLQRKMCTTNPVWYPRSLTFRDKCSKYHFRNHMYSGYQIRFPCFIQLLNYLNNTELKAILKRNNVIVKPNRTKEELIQAYLKI